MRTAFSLSVAVAAAAVAAAPAAALDQPDGGDPSEVVVVGHADRDQAVRNYVKAITDISAINPIGRFDRGKVCPAVVGLSDANNASIAERMRRVAQAAGIPVDEPGCGPNALVIFTADKDELVKAMRKANPAWFTNPGGRQVEIGRQNGPVTAWHLEQRIDRSGRAVGGDNEGGPTVVTTPVVPSRVSATVRPVFVASVVVIEVASVDGLTVTQVADYAAMRSFAKVDPTRLAKSSAPTILTVLGAAMDSQVPVTLTQWDLSYLKALYSAVPTRFGRQQAGEISRRIAEDLDQASTAAERQ